MEIISGIQFFGNIIFLIIYVVSPDFREKQRIIKEENQKAYNIYISNKKKEEALKKIEIRNEKIKKNEDLVDICLENPYDCIIDQILILKIKSNLKNEKFKLEFLNAWDKTFNNSFYGCFCRQTPNFDIYDTCPLSDSKLDYACKKRHECLRNNDLKWNSLSKCDSELMEAKNYYLEVDNRKKDRFDYHFLSLLYSKKFYALLKLKEMIN